MYGHISQRMLNVTLRMAGMGSRFLLTIVLARLLEPSELGMLGLLLTTIAFGVVLIGGDYYTYCQRELLSLPRNHWSFVIQHQILAIGIIYILFFPLLAMQFVFGTLPFSLIGWFFSLLVVDHVVTEINRLLVAMQRPLLASLVLFIRMGAWVWLVLPIMWFVPESRKVEVVFVGWLLGGVLAIAIGVRSVIREAAPMRLWPLDRAWLLRGFGVGIMFLLATLCFKALTTFDRFVFEALNNLELLGVYVFYFSFTTAILYVLDAAIFSFLYPRLLRAYKEGNMAGYRHIRSEMIWATLGVSLVLTASIAFVTPYLLKWIGRPLYTEHLSLLWWLLTIAAVYAVGMIPHFGLYARSADRSILIASVSSLLVFAFVTSLCARPFPLYAAPIGLLAAITWMGGLKLMQYRRFLRREQSVRDMPVDSI